MYFAAEIDILSIVLPFFFYFAAQIAALNDVNLFYVKVKTLHAAPSWLLTNLGAGGRRWRVFGVLKYASGEHCR